MKTLLLLPLVAAVAFGAEPKIGNTNGVGAQYFTTGSKGADIGVQCRSFMPDAGVASQVVAYISGQASSDGGIANDAGPKATAAPTLNGPVMDFTVIQDPYRFKLGPLATRISVIAVDAGPSNCDFFSEYPPPGPRSSNGSAEFGNVALNSSFATQDNITLYVNGNPGAGNDANACTSAAAPCATHQGALNKLPKFHRHGVVLSTASGVDGGAINYPCFNISGFTQELGYPADAGGLLITGDLVPATLSTGATSGSAVGGSAGSGVTFGTLQGGDGGWTTNELQGLLVSEVVAGVTTVRPISSNTGNTLTVVGTWTSPTGSPFTIQTPGWVINTACPAYATGTNGASATSPSGVWVHSNNFTSRGNAIQLRNVGWAVDAGSAIQVTDASQFTVSNFRMSTPAAGGSVGGAVAANGGAKVSLTVGSFTGQTTSYLAYGNGAAGFSLTNVLSYGSNAGLLALPTPLAATNSRAVAVTSSEAKNATTAALMLTSSSDLLGVSQLNRFDCATSAGIGIVVGHSNTTTTYTSGLQGPFSQASFTTNAIGGTCGIGVYVGANGIARLGALSGSAATTAIMVNWGGRADTESLTITAGTNEVSIDNGARTGLFSQFNTGCTQMADGGTSAYGTKFCK